jgi:hypothetical protein
VIILFVAQFPGIEGQAVDRLTQDQGLYDTKTHQLRDGMTKEQARAILLVASHMALGCGLKLVLTSEEKELMSKKFKI